jgi:small subunit ribosomal protein S18
MAKTRRFSKRRRKKIASRYGRESKCRFCREKVDLINYKDIEILQKLTTSQGKLFSRKRSGNCARHQKQAKLAVKRARFLSLLPYKV